MNTMTVFFFGRRYRDKADAINKADKETSQIHETNVEALAIASKSADNLRQVLEANGITIKIQKATGHKHDTRNYQSAL